MSTRETIHGWHDSEGVWTAVEVGNGRLLIERKHEGHVTGSVNIRLGDAREIRLALDLIEGKAEQTPEPTQPTKEAFILEHAPRIYYALMSALNYEHAPIYVIARAARLNAADLYDELYPEKVSA